MDEYQLLDSGDGKKWEKFGPWTLCRPCGQAIWRPQHRIQADASFSREGGNNWVYRTQVPKEWTISFRGVKCKLSLTDFGHLGIFPEHAALWDWMRPLLGNKDRVLNLFAYSGGATFAAAQTGAEVCHLDASKGMVDWARENCTLNGLQGAKIRWIVDDAIKFLRREEKRNSKYDGIILDPPTFGRGGKGEIFKIEDEILSLLTLCKNVLSEKPKFVIFTCHTPGFTPIVLSHLMKQVFGSVSDSGEMTLASEQCFCIPSGSFARICYD